MTHDPFNPIPNLESYAQGEKVVVLKFQKRKKRWHT